MAFSPLKNWIKVLLIIQSQSLKISFGYDALRIEICFTISVLTKWFSWMLMPDAIKATINESRSFLAIFRLWSRNIDFGTIHVMMSTCESRDSVGNNILFIIIYEADYIILWILANYWNEITKMFKQALFQTKVDWCIARWSWNDHTTFVRLMN